MAVFHHKPDAFGALGWLAAEADRLSSGMDRKPRDYEAAETEAEHKGWDAFIKTPLRSIFGSVDLGLGDPPPCQQPLAELIPDDRLLPVAKLDASDYQARYRHLWDVSRPSSRRCARWTTSSCSARACCRCPNASPSPSPRPRWTYPTCRCTTTTAPSPPLPPACIAGMRLNGTLDDEQGDPRPFARKSFTCWPATCPGFSIPCSCSPTSRSRASTRFSAPALSCWG